MIRSKYALDFHASSTDFLIMETDRPIAENVLVYDGNSASDVYRIFAPSNRAVVAQMGKRRTMPSDKICERTKVLLGYTDGLEIVTERHLRNCYPIAVSDRSTFDILCADLEAKGLIMFGRFAQWQCLDLHELEWQKLIYDKIQHSRCSVGAERRH
jgi:hypothetical protein